MPIPRTRAPRRAKDWGDEPCPVSPARCVLYAMAACACVSVVFLAVVWVAVDDEDGEPTAKLARAQPNTVLRAVPATTSIPAKSSVPPQAQAQASLPSPSALNEKSGGSAVTNLSPSPAQTPSVTAAAPAAGEKPKVASSHPLGDSSGYNVHKYDELVMNKRSPIKREVLSPCEDMFGFEMVDRWNAAAAEFCRPSTENSPEETRVTCRVMRHPQYPPPTAPHTYCDVTNLYMDFSKMNGKRSAPVHRGGYNVKKDMYTDYQRGALSGVCTLDASQFNPPQNVQNFPNDNLKDVFGSFTAVSVAPTVDLIINEPTLFVTREPGEHVNYSHTMTDMINAFMAFYLFKLDAEKTRMMFLDRAPWGLFDRTWAQVFAPSRDVYRVEDMEGKRVLFKHAIFVPPGYTNAWWSNLMGENPCNGHLGLYRAMYRFFMEAYGLGSALTQIHEKLKVRLISRRPYTKKEVQHSFMGRQIKNEEELFQAIKSRCEERGDCTAELVDYAHTSFAEQLEITAETDLFVAMHGAGLTNALFMPEYGGVIELRHGTEGIWWLFQHTTQWAGRIYKPWINSDKSKWTKDDKGEYLEVDIPGAIKVVDDVLNEIVVKRDRFAQDLKQTPP